MRDGNQSAIDIQRVEALARSPVHHIGMKTFARSHQRREEPQRSALRRSFDLFHDCGHALFFHGQIAIGTKLCSDFRKQEPKEMIDLGDRRNS